MATEEEQIKQQNFQEVKRAFNLRIDRCQTPEDLMAVCQAIQLDPVGALQSFFDIELDELGSQTKSITSRKSKLADAKDSVSLWQWT